jgi:hypothetical protein
MSTPTYPVRVDATLDDRLSRWLWLVKWFLAIPHFVVLALLWVAYVVLSVVALMAILVTARYPRAIFDFNVGVLRWSWRVAYYAYSGLGTDQYPPFSLREISTYPAHLEVEYPDDLSRGLVLVKWWLLAIPHYLVVGILAGAGWYVARDGDVIDARNGGGLIGILVLVAAVVLLFTGRYPRSIFEFVLGLNRWVLRVAAYASLMTDKYPPFRLDLGGRDPGTAVIALPDDPTTRPDPTAPGGGGRVTAVVLGSLLALVGLGLLAGGGVAQLANTGMRDDDGYLTSSAVELESQGFAVTSEGAELHSGPGPFAVPEQWVGTVKVEANGPTGTEVFIGIASTRDVEAYLTGVAHSVVLDPVGDHGSPALRFTDGGPPALEPTEATFWSASAAGEGPQELVWRSREGSWTVVVMNAEGTAPVMADVAVGATVPVLDDVAVSLVVAGLVLGGISALVLYVAVLRRGAGRKE